MASIGSRASGFWAESAMSSTYTPTESEDEDEGNQLLEDGQEDPSDTRTALDKTIDRIGMGSYQWTLLSLCGFGWLADNMWLQAIAIILPRVQQHYSIPDSYIGTVSSAMFAGMMFGAVGWGTCSDLMGRSMAFNGTLFFTAVFGLLASFTNSFASLCLVLFFLGSSVGGSMPTDGTLLLEHMPQGKQYLVTALSVFFSFGSVISAVIALVVLPRNSCPHPPATCDVNTQNQGWKYLLITLGLCTLAMFLARMVFFRLHESPRFLVHAGRHQEAVDSLQMISRFNGSDLSIGLKDVDDTRAPEPSVQTINAEPSQTVLSPKFDEEAQTVFDADLEERVTTPRQLQKQVSTQHLRSGENNVDYSSTSESPPQLDSHAFATPELEHQEIAFLPQNDAPSSLPPRRQPRPKRPGLRQRDSRRQSSMLERRMCHSLPRWLRNPLWKWWDRVMMVLSPEWLRITLFMWGAWCGMALAYTMFNVFLPKLLETGSSETASAPKSLEETLWDVVIFTLGGCPGAILGAYLVDTRLGRRWSLAGSTFLTAVFCAIFAMVQSSILVRICAIAISLSSTTMWAVLYGWTPEIFGTKVRGTACGIASALSRIGGMIAPIVGGLLLMIDRSVPVYTSVVIFALAGGCVLMLKETDGESGRGKGQKTFVH